MTLNRWLAALCWLGCAPSFDPLAEPNTYNFTRKNHAKIDFAQARTKDTNSTTEPDRSVNDAQLRTMLKNLEGEPVAAEKAACVLSMEATVADIGTAKTDQELKDICELSDAQRSIMAEMGKALDDMKKGWIVLRIL